MNTDLYICHLCNRDVTEDDIYSCDRCDLATCDECLISCDAQTDICLYENLCHKCALRHSICFNCNYIICESCKELTKMKLCSSNRCTNELCNNCGDSCHGNNDRYCWGRKMCDKCYDLCKYCSKIGCENKICPWCHKDRDICKDHE